MAEVHTCVVLVRAAASIPAAVVQINVNVVGTLLIGLTLQVLVRVATLEVPAAVVVGSVVAVCVVRARV